MYGTLKYIIVKNLAILELYLRFRLDLLVIMRIWHLPSVYQI